MSTKALPLEPMSPNKADFDFSGVKYYRQTGLEKVFELPFLQTPGENYVDRRLQVYLFSHLRKRRVISIGHRSGTLDGCSSFIGIPTMTIDNEKAKQGHSRLGKLNAIQEIVPETESGVPQHTIESFLKRNPLQHS